MILPFSIDIFSFIPAIGAASLSLKNWLQLRQGAVILPTKILNYGIWGIDAQTTKNKVLVIPIILNNDGSRAGMVTNIGISFDGIDLEIRRKVNLVQKSEQEIRNMSVNEFRNKGIEGLNPFYPINVYSKEGESLLMECFDGNNIIPLGKTVTCKITVDYGVKSSSSIEFPFHLSEADFNKSLDHLVWARSD